MNAQFESQLQGIVTRVAPQSRREPERRIAVVRGAGGTSYDNVLALAQDTRQAPDVRLAAIWTLEHLKDTRAVPALLHALTDEHPAVRQAAAMSLGLLDDERAVSPLIAALQTDKDSSVRKATAYALRWLGNASAVNPLLHVLQNRSEDAAVRGEAAESLGELGARQALPSLIAALQDPSAEVRLWSAFALGTLGDARALPELERIAATDGAVVPHLAHLSSRGVVKKEASEAIGRIRA